MILLRHDLGGAFFFVFVADMLIQRCIPRHNRYCSKLNTMTLFRMKKCKQTLIRFCFLYWRLDDGIRCR